MHSGQFLFSQLMAFLPKRDFDRCVRKYRGNYRTRRFSCLDQFLSMAFAQLTYRTSLRDIEICLNAMKPKLYHVGIRGNIARNTLAKANQNRNWRIYADFAAILIAHARKLYAGDALSIELEQTVYAFDSTTIDLCLALFPWASFRKRKGAVKLHTLIDLRGNIPCFVHVSCGKMHDVLALDHLPLEPSRILYHDSRLHCFRPPLHLSGEHGFLCHPCQEKHEMPLPSGKPCRYQYRSALRSHHRPFGAHKQERISSSPPPGQIRRSSHQQALCVPDQQFCV